jgi:hypothetical protein
MDAQLLQELMAALQLTYEQAGWIGAAGAALTFLLRLYRMDTVQGLLPQKAKWDSLPKWGKFLLPFLLSMGGASLAALGGGATWLAALIGGLTAGLASVGAHHGTKALGNKLITYKIKKDAFYEPTRLDKILSPLLPIPKEAYRKTADKEP